MVKGRYCLIPKILALDNVIGLYPDPGYRIPYESVSTQGHQTESIDAVL